ncbi:hypothetical protein Amet_3424 [Alkaliphilus metalliredigens QYMF]|uniref:ATP-grasp domain-containing protein n=1 Tax=Alkaliphilus metalliredigens (strain QYMF) TaxID=293826 RepID=A6TTN4_ALKMQ|nr:YheC/YheD family protein [Alkaliphilus metalliredigens]ABR49552.1 hypothetical protein Amet_3424 [Alkaliphilus metalliredigens QYMF]
MEVSWLNSLESNNIAINSNLYEELLQPQKIVVHYGMLEVSLAVLINNELSEGTIGLPMNFTDQYTIPKDIPYETYFKEGALYIGPIILHVSLGSKQFKRKSYAFNLPMFLDYASIKGLIVTCTEKSIDVDSGIVEGYYLDPKAKNLKNAWKYGKFPLPNAIFNHSFMSQKKVTAIQNKIGNRIFNTYLLNLDKWNTWKFLSQNDMLKKYIPYTEKYTSTKQLKSLLNRYGSLYLKPCNDGGGMGIMKLDKTKTGITLIDNNRKKHSFSNYQELSQFLKTRIASIAQQSAHFKTNSPLLSQFLGNKLTTSYIVQQSVHFKKNDHHVDFRLVLQKNSNLEWHFTGLVARIAHKGSIITNKRGRQKMISGRTALTSIYGVSEERTQKIETEMTNVVIKTVEMYEKLGYHLGDVVADIALDSNFNIWLLELQLYYSINGWRTKGLRNFFVNVATTPFKYAKALAGFIESQ